MKIFILLLGMKSLDNLTPKYIDFHLKRENKWSFEVSFVKSKMKCSTHPKFNG